MAEYINVTTLNLLAKQVLEQCEPLNNLIVCGEVSNFTRHYKSGHCYFTLKDENAAIKCVMFRDKARLLGFAPENGMLVLAYGRATLYERDGAFQLYCDYMRPFGAGAAQMAFDALKKKLSAEGLFDADHKRPLPPMPQCIGLVTSKTGAALQDVIHIITRRWPMVKLLLAPVSVQGLEAEKSIVDGIRRLDADPRPDIILITRGGGSKEDLWVFNSERIARAAYACKKPVVSAVGHETDTTIADYAADLRAPTPSAAAELAVFEIQDLLGRLEEYHAKLNRELQQQIAQKRQGLKLYENKLSYLNPKSQIEEKKQHYESIQIRLESAMKTRILTSRQELRLYIERMKGLSPLDKLNQGFSYVENEAHKAVTSISQVKSGETLLIQVSDGTIEARSIGTKQVERGVFDDTGFETKRNTDDRRSF